MSTAKLTWSSEWPTKKGTYWFYGRRFRGDNMDTYVIKVGQSSNKVWMYFSEACFIHEQEGAKGFWAPAILPVPPPEMIESLNADKQK